MTVFICYKCELLLDQRTGGLYLLLFHTPFLKNLTLKLIHIFDKNVQMSIKTNRLNLGDYLREIRTEKGLSLKDLASSLDVDLSLLSKIERGERSLSMDMVPALSRALEIDFKQLQTDLLALRVIHAFGKEEFASEGLKKALRRMVH